MNKILIITGILPIKEIEKKKNENDIILITEDRILERYNDIVFQYFFIFPFANFILAKLSSKWNSYYKLKQKNIYSLRGRLLFLLPIIMLPQKKRIESALVKISMFRERRKIDTIMNDFMPSVIHAQDIGVCSYIARNLSKRYKIPYVVTLRGFYQDDNTSSVQRNIDCASSIIAISPQQLKNGRRMTKKSIFCIPHGVDKAFYVSHKDNKKTDGPLRIILVSRLLSIKNTDLVIAALKHFHYDFIFDIYGDGPEEKALKDLVLKLELENKIYFKGRVPNDELPRIYSQYDLFVMPSYPETLGRVYFEAMASGLPVICSKNTGIDGLIIDGKEGYILNPLEKQEFNIQFLKKMEELYENRSLLNKMKENAIEFSKKYTWDEISAKYYKIYTKALNNGIEK